MTVINPRLPYSTKRMSRYGYGRFGAAHIVTRYDACGHSTETVTVGVCRGTYSKALPNFSKRTNLSEIDCHTATADFLILSDPPLKECNLRHESTPFCSNLWRGGGRPFDGASQPLVLTRGVIVEICFANVGKDGALASL